MSQSGHVSVLNQGCQLYIRGAIQKYPEWVHNSKTARSRMLKFGQKLTNTVIYKVQKLQMNTHKIVYFMVAMATVPMATRPNLLDCKSMDFQILLHSTYARPASHFCLFTCGWNSVICILSSKFNVKLKKKIDNNIISLKRKHI